MLATDIKALLPEVIITLGKVGPKAKSAEPELRKLFDRDALIKAEVQNALKRID